MIFEGTFLLAIWVSTVCGQGYQQVALELHNQYRAMHNVDPLSASDDLNNRAVQCAQYYAARGTIDHSCPYKNGAGENLWTRYPDTISDDDAAREATNSWYSEESRHNYNLDWQPATGHFSQVVWRGSREFGFGTGRSGGTIVGCALYNPPGNTIGEYRNNVPEKGATATSPGGSAPNEAAQNPSGGLLTLPIPNIGNWLGPLLFNG